MREHFQSYVAARLNRNGLTLGSWNLIPQGRCLFYARRQSTWAKSACVVQVIQNADVSCSARPLKWYELSRQTHLSFT